MHPFRLCRHFLLATGLLCVNLRAEPIPVRYHQGSEHGFLALKTMEGVRIAIGDVTQVVRGDQVTSRLIFRFRDGSVSDETTVFVQHGTFRLISDHLVQHGPSFPTPVDMFVDARTGEITTHAKGGGITRVHLDLPADVSNGLPPNLLLNISPSTPETKISFVAPTAKPRLVHVSIKPAGKVAFNIGPTRRTAIDYVLHIEIGGVSGVIAPIIGKQPADYHVWILPGSSPAFVREEGALYEGGPIWRIEQISPSFPR
jgi:hypothetical protein